MKTKYIFIFFILIGLTACQNDDDGNIVAEPVELTAGSADFSRYVSVGNSLSAGYMDNALFRAGQELSFPNLLAQRFSLVGGGAFTQPLMNDNVGGLLFNGVPNPAFGPRLFINPATTEISQVNALPTTEVFAPSAAPYNNLAVPGAKSFHLLFDGYGNPVNLAPPSPTANPYFVRMASAPNTTVLGDAMSQSPTFFSLWIGNNDVLGYATSGGDGSNPITPSAGPPGIGFDQTFAAIIATLTSGGAQGVVANIPDVTALPFFTAVPHNPLDPTNPAFGPQISTLNAAFAPLNAAFSNLGMPERIVSFSSVEPSPIVIHDESLPNITLQLFQELQDLGVDFLTSQLLAAQYGQSRQATADDLIVLLASTAIATLNQDYFNQLVFLGVPPATAGQLAVNGVTYPMEDKWVLLPSEQLEVKSATEGFNAVIASAAQGAGLALVDANSFLNELAGSGVSFGDFTLTSDLVLGGAFSLDGVHPNSRGYSVGANAFLRAIDATYGSNFEASGNFYNPGDFPTNYPESLQ
ncbi:MAG: G-D-S-L family lipolytic protein [Bacteroidia bacterium]|nr:G-D-S-L family lipolytic protein [Bacteroidia bacterium]